jgi:hypothetical protein
VRSLFEVTEWLVLGRGYEKLLDMELGFVIAQSAGKT